jgi:hypothetical protein
MLILLRPTSSFSGLQRLSAPIQSLVLFGLKVRVTLRLAVYHQSGCLDVKPLETHDQTFFFSTELLIDLM